MDGWCPFINAQGRRLLEKHWRELTPPGVKDLSFKWIKMFTTVTWPTLSTLLYVFFVCLFAKWFCFCKKFGLELGGTIVHWNYIDILESNRQI